MNLNDFIDRSTLGHVESYGGYQVHIQALAKEQYSRRVALLVLQGRPTNVRAVWARFHGNDLGYQLSRYPGKVYAQPNPTAKLPQGDLEICIIHQGLLPTTVNDETSDGQRFTFGPPHFLPLFQAAFPIPARPHWEEKLWDLAWQCRLINKLVGWNTQVWSIRGDTKTWLAYMARPEWRQYWTYEPEVVRDE